MSEDEQTNVTPSPFDAVINTIPEHLRPVVEKTWQRYAEAAREAQLTPPNDKDALAMLGKVWAVSEFAAETCIRQPEMLAELLASGDLRAGYTEGAYRRKLDAALAEVADDAALMRALRLLRAREMLRIAVRDIVDWAELRETIADLSALAESCIDLALTQLHEWQCGELGEPRDSHGQPQRMVVLGMGKLGAGELNFSSDIDLMFVYPAEGHTHGARAELDNAEYFTRLGRRLIRALDQKTGDGFVFRVDMRLRPFGESGPLALNFDAMEDYYQTHGREWERYAMIKARVVAGDRAAGAELMRALRPFVYRRYLDFGTFESLRDMKALVQREVRRKSMERNIKLGAGGIREIEFIGQTFQLIRGGRMAALRIRPILEVLDVLADNDLLPRLVVGELQAAYVFLRDLEHRLQMYRDEQTQDLPQDSPGDELERARLAYAMGYADWPALAAAIAAHRGRVHAHFEQLIAAPRTEQEDGGGPDYKGVWSGSLGDTQTQAFLAAAGFRDGGEVQRRLDQFRDSYACRALSTQGRERMDKLMPLLLEAAANVADPDRAFGRAFKVIEAVARRTAYLALLIEYPLALSQMVQLCAASPWIADQVARHAMLLDEMLDPRTLYAPLDSERLQADLTRRLEGIEADDLERQMDELRHFKQSNVLRVAAADVNAAMPLMHVSDHLTEIGEVVLGQSLNLAMAALAARHGVPRCVYDGEACESGFLIVAYGKLGGIELGYGSDLDLVFLYSDDCEASTGTGPERKGAIDAAVFFARLGQRLTHILNTQTPAGVLYEVDLRLRPSGASGLLVSDLRAFRDYQLEDAWTWEHQALVRARPVAGDALLARAFRDIRAEVLSRPRDAALLCKEVREMRERMRTELDRSRGTRFDLKQGTGGIADIEFMVQYGVLRWAPEHPALLNWTDNIRLLDTLVECGLLNAGDGRELADIYRAYRGEVHRLTLQEERALAEAADYAEQRATVTRIWRALMLDQHGARETSS